MSSVKFDEERVAAFRARNIAFDLALGTEAILFSNEEHLQIQNLDCVFLLRVIAEKMKNQGLYILGIVALGPNFV